MNLPCSTTNDQLLRDARPDCHSIFGGPGGTFSGCNPGAKAHCSPLVTCAVGPPNCPAGTVVAYMAAGCYEGCVRPTECAP